MIYIYETVVYCGRLKEWRIWNITTATVYSSSFETQEAAYEQAKSLTEPTEAMGERFYIITVFNNGQMKTEEYEYI